MTPSVHYETGRAALVTGASRGIGRAIALGLAEDGYDLIGVHFARDEAAAQDTSREIEARGGVAVPLRAELSGDPVAASTALAAEFTEAVASQPGLRMAALVNNAGIGAPQSLGQIDAHTYEQVVGLNLTAPLFLTQALAPQLGQGGRVINISTGYTRIAAPTHVAYSAAKCGLNGITRALAPELGQRGVTINAVTPGVIETDMNSEWLAEPGVLEAMSARTAFGRIGQPDDVAALVRYLASPAAGWTTGQVIDATGGTAL